MPKVAISIGDVNGVGIEIALKAHKHIKQWCEPLYCVHKEVIESASAILNYQMPLDMQCIGSFAYDKDNLITPSNISAKSGIYSYESFMQGVKLTQNKECIGLATLPIHKKAWQEAGIPYAGHTHALSHYFKANGIMMLGCEELFVALFTDHIPLSQVSKYINKQDIKNFLLSFASAVDLNEPCCILGLNPHCGDNGVMGYEDKDITIALQEANDVLQKDIFFGAYPPDSAFSPLNRSKFRYFVSMYHDVGLAPLKALYFEQSINVSLNLPILRTSVDHGVAYDKAYRADSNISITSYINAIKYITNRANASAI